MAEDYTDLISLFDARAKMYGMLARLFRTELTMEDMKELQGMRFPVGTGNMQVDQGYRLLFNYLKSAWDDSITELAIDYARTFIGHGVNGYSAAYPFESVYTSERRLMMQEARADVLRIFRENGFKRDKWNEGEDHIALELEFIQRMSLRVIELFEAGDEEGAVENLQTQQSFVENHLLNWLPMLVADMQQFAKTDFYKGLGTLTLGYVREDYAVLGELLSD